MRFLSSKTISALALITATTALSAEGDGIGSIIVSPTMWPLLILSVVGFAFAIISMMTIKDDLLTDAGTVDDIHAILGDEEVGVNEETIEEAIGVAEGDESVSGKVIFAALEKEAYGIDAMVEAGDNELAKEHNELMSKINWLSLFASIGPMFGLLGTVIGMIQAFFKMAASGGAVDPVMLSGSIGGAMITTASGLIIAIPMLFFFFYLRSKINRAVLATSVYTGEVLDYFRGNND